MTMGESGITAPGMGVLDVHATLLYSGTSDDGHSEEWTNSLQWTNCFAPHCPYISTSEERTTSEQWTKFSSPMCPLFGGPTVYYGICKQ